jgi:hypothetical protein
MQHAKAKEPVAKEAKLMDHCSRPPAFADPRGTQPRQLNAIATC